MMDDIGKTGPFQHAEYLGPRVGSPALGTEQHVEGKECREFRSVLGIVQDEFVDQDNSARFEYPGRLLQALLALFLGIAMQNMGEPGYV